MNGKVTFEVPGKPIGKQRPRFVSRGGFTRAITPEKTVSFENFVRLCYAEKEREFLEDEIRITLRFYFPIPKSASKKKRAQMILGDIRPTTKPDTDNCIKSVLDSLNGLAFHDDSQIVEVNASKWYGIEPRTEIILERVVHDGE